MKLSVRLQLIVAGVALLTGIALAGVGLVVSGQTLSAANRNALDIVAADRSHNLHSYFERIEKDLALTAESPITIEALKAFSRAYTELGDSATSTLQNAYIGQNPNPLGQKYLLDSAQTGSAYDAVHAQYHTIFRRQLTAWDYNDMFLFDTSGNLVYTVFKKSDYATNFRSGGGQWADTDLGEVFRRAVASPKGTASFVDFKPYAPSAGTPASFIAMPIMNASGTPIGVIAIQMPVGGINAIMDGKIGLGETGESIIVGADHLMRNDSHFTAENDILNVTFADSYVDKAVRGDAAFGTSDTYRQLNMTIAAEPFEFGGVHWAVIAAQGTDELNAGVSALRHFMLVAGVGLIGVALVCGYFLARGISLPLQRLTLVMGRIADKDFRVDIPGADRSDEIGEMARAVVVFREDGVKIADLTAAEEELLATRTRERAEMLEKLQRAFGMVVNAAAGGDFSQRVTDEFPDAELNDLADSVNRLVETVDRGLSESGQVLSALAQTDLTMRVEGDYKGAFERLKSDTNAVADKLSEVIRQLRDTSRGVKTATGEILLGANDLSERTTRQAATIEETSAAMEQLSSTVVTNARQAEEANTNSRNVSQTAEAGGEVMNEANAAMQRITAASSKISNIIGMIDDIAFQTNLLALNASVEAARAGEAGKGFAVVAVEVRRLAQSAAEASNEVKQLVEQSAIEVAQGSKLVGDASEKLKQILEAVKSNGTLITSIATASREQASAIDEVNIAVRQMDEMTQHNAALVEQTNAAIEQTEAQANELDRIVEVFRLKEATTRAAPLAARPALGAKVQSAKQTYLSHGNVAVDAAWAKF